MQSLGVITVAAAGTTQVLASASTPCTQILIKPMRAAGASGTPPTPNTGVIYIKNVSTAKGTTGAGVVLAIETGADTFSFVSPARNGFDLSKLYMDADTNGDGALISFV